MSSLGSNSRLSPPTLRRQLIAMDACLMIAITLGFFVVLLRAKILPARFMGDEQTIQQLAQGRWVAEGDNSYSQVSQIYRVLGLANEPAVAGVIGFLIACIPYIFVCVKYRKNGSDLTVVAVSTVGILFSAVYMGTYSKEIFVVPIIMLIIMAPLNIPGSVALYSSMVLYATYFRSYWFLVLIFLFYLSVLVRKNFSGYQTYLICAIGILAGSVLFSVIMGVPSDHFRNSVNLHRAAIGDVNTLIPRYLEVWPPLDGPVNNVLSFIFLQFPLPLLVKLSPYYLLLFVILTALWVGLFKSINKINALSNNMLKRRLMRLVLVTLAFVMTQAFFEPDFGSALRHLTPFLSLFVMVHLAIKEPPYFSSAQKGQAGLGLRH